jgi:ATP-dependent protease ClpP protease subunit
MEKSEEQPFLLNKQFYVQHFFEAEDCLKGGLIDKCLKVYRAAESFNDFLI